MTNCETDASRKVTKVAAVDALRLSFIDGTFKGLLSCQHLQPEGLKSARRLAVAGPQIWKDHFWWRLVGTELLACLRSTNHLQAVRRAEARDSGAKCFPIQSTGTKMLDFWLKVHGMGGGTYCPQQRHDWTL